MSWDSICKTKAEGGLGLQDSVWNLTCVLRNLWDIIISSGSLYMGGMDQEICIKRLLRMGC